MEAVVIGARLVQLAAVALLFGGAAFLVYGLKGAQVPDWSRALFIACATAALAGALASLSAQTAVMADDPRAALDIGLLGSVVGDSVFGRAVLVRFVAIGLALLALLARPAPWRVTTVLGAVAIASFAWSGHGAADDGVAGLVHTAADVTHLLAAGVWLGALAVLAIQLITARTVAQAQALHAALAGFAGVGSAAVALILASGVANAWFLVDPSRITGLADTPYGALLLVKVALFAGMLALAALNRLRLTPSLAASLAAGRPSPAVAILRRSVGLETALGLGVLVVVAVLGTLDPVSSL
jgi:putative copper resistance protein D